MMNRSAHCLHGAFSSQLVPRRRRYQGSDLPSDSTIPLSNETRLRPPEYLHVHTSYTHNHVLHLIRSVSLWGLEKC